MDTLSSATKIEQRIVFSATQKRIPLGGAFELLPLCNMNCSMCFLRLTPEEMQNQGTLRSSDEWLTLASEAQKDGLLFLLLTGGEPFLFPEFTKLYKGLCKLGLILTINTNGTLITEEYANLLHEHKPRRVNITLYGSSDEVYEKLCHNPNGFTQVMNGIRLLKERDIPIKLNGSLTKYNQDDLENIQKVAKELDLPIEIDTYMFPCSRKGSLSFNHEARLNPTEAAESYIKVKQNEWSTEQFQEMAQQMSDCYRYGKDSSETLPPDAIPCRAGLSSFWINWKGHMTPCVFMEEPHIPVFEKGFHQSWEYIKQKRDQMFLPQKCSSCKNRNFCSVCAASVINETGCLAEVPSYVCKLTAEKLRLMDEIVHK